MKKNTYKNKSKCEKYFIKKDQSINRFLYDIFNQMIHNFNQIRDKYLLGIELNMKPIENNVSFPKTDLKNAFPLHFKSLIKNRIKYELVKNFTIGGKDITIFFMTEKKLSFKMLFNKVSMILLWLELIFSNIKTQCSNKLTIYLYDINKPKKIPNGERKSLYDYDVNTAFTYCCIPNNEIIIFRQEEWFKVFIHETFHSFGMDFARSDKSFINERMKTIFNIDINFDLTESWCETWARIFNIIFASFWYKFQFNNYTLFQKDFYKRLNLETCFSIFQMNKILKLKNLTYIDLTSNKGLTNYSENTAAFSYYIVTCLNLINIVDFIGWCNSHNKILYQFYVSDSNIKEYINFIKTISKKKKTKGYISCIKTNKTRKCSLKPKMENTLRMSVNEIAFI